MTYTHKHTFTLNGIKDEYLENIKDNCDKKPSKETFLDLKKNAIKLGKSGGTTKQSRQSNNNTTTKKGDHDEGNHRPFKLTDFPSEIWAMISPEVKQWFIHLKKAAASGEPIIVKYGGQ